MDVNIPIAFLFVIIKTLRHHHTHTVLVSINQSVNQSVMVGEEEGILSCLVGEKDSTLRQVFISISTSISEISRAIRTTSTDAVGSSNTFGDTQLVADLMAESVIRARLEQCEYVGVISSEEHPEETVVSDAPEAVFSVAFDPLDGSSIIGSNFSVGSIFGVWKHRGFLGQSGRDMVGAAYAVYGPRTVMVCAYQIGGEDTCVDEYTLFDDSQGWKLTKKNIRLEERKKLFAPANLRASKDNEEYASLMRQWMEQQYTLRYTGGMVPDIHNIITKV